jgi:hypothetical protein
VIQEANHSGFTPSTDAEFKDYIKNVFLPGSYDNSVDELAKYYPEEKTEDIHLDTGNYSIFTPQFKRLAAVQGDGVFQAPRRWLIGHTSGKQDAWVYCKYSDLFLL